MMKKLSIGLIVLLVIALVVIYWLWPNEQEVAYTPPVVDPTTSRLTEQGEYVGFMDVHGARAWLGIPYAKPPVDELRWRAPLPPDRHSGIKEALTHGSMCLQPPNPTVRGGTESVGGVIGSEDCLYLNIWSPPNSIKSPVMLWLHGGGNSIGEAATYNGAVLAAKHNVVVVAINYRLGVLGWFNHPAVLAANDQSSGNFGTLDIVQALTWVRDNIRSFGGDPERVTIFGESAGGVNVLSMVVSDLASGLFHRAISQSGGFSPTDPAVGHQFHKDGGHINSASELAKRVLLLGDHADNEEEATALLTEWNAFQIAEILQSTEPATLFANLGQANLGMVNFPGLFGDNVVLPAGETHEIFGDLANFNNVPIILGTNRDEPTLFMMQNPAYVDTIFGFIPRLKDENDYRRVVYYGAQAWKARGVDNIATVLRQIGHDDVFAYRFDWDEVAGPFFFDLSVALGAGHAMEIPFVFGNFNALEGLAGFFPNDEAQFKLSGSMMSYWAEFAHTGDPWRGRGGEETEWSRFGENQQTTIVFDTDSGGGIRMIEELVTYESLRDELLTDKSFSDQDLYCRTYVTTIGGTPAFSKSDYDSVGCDHINPDEVSWY